jgi:hypothetical protein
MLFCSSYHEARLESKRFLTTACFFRRGCGGRNFAGRKRFPASSVGDGMTGFTGQGDGNPLWCGEAGRKMKPQIHDDYGRIPEN